MMNYGYEIHKERIEYAKEEINVLKSDIGYANKFDPRMVAEWVFSKPELFDQWLEDHDEYRQARIEELKEEIEERKQKMRKEMVEKL